MSKFANNIVPYVDEEIRQSNAAESAGQSALVFSHLERAHIIG